MSSSKAIVFAYKTYLTPLTEVKEKEGKDAALALAEAIEGLRKGSAPDVWVYKRGFEWEEKVVQYLRECGNRCNFSMAFLFLAKRSHNPRRRL